MKEFFLSSTFHRKINISLDSIGKILWCESKGISMHRIWDACHLIFYDFSIPMIFQSYEPKEAWMLLFLAPNTQINTKQTVINYKFG